jgi:hypothetical protein
VLFEPVCLSGAGTDAFDARGGVPAAPAGEESDNSAPPGTDCDIHPPCKRAGLGPLVTETARGASEGAVPGLPLSTVAAGAAGGTWWTPAGVPPGYAPLAAVSLPQNVGLCEKFEPTLGCVYDDIKYWLSIYMKCSAVSIARVYACWIEFSAAIPSDQSPAERRTWTLQVPGAWEGRWILPRLLRSMYLLK